MTAGSEDEMSSRMRNICDDIEQVENGFVVAHNPVLGREEYIYRNWYEVLEHLTRRAGILGVGESFEKWLAINMPKLMAANKEAQ